MSLYCVTTADGSIREPTTGIDSKVLFTVSKGTKVEILTPDCAVKLKPSIFSHTYVKVIVRSGSHKQEKGWCLQDKLAPDPSPFQ